MGIMKVSVERIVDLVLLWVLYRPKWHGFVTLFSFLYFYIKYGQNYGCDDVSYLAEASASA